MTPPTGWLPVPLNPDGGLPQAAPLPAPDGDLRLVVLGVAPDLAALLGAPPDRTVWTSADALARRPGPDPGAPQDVRDIAAATALTAFTGAPGVTLSAAQVRTVVLVLAGTRVLAAQPAVPGRPLAVLDGDRLRGHLWVDEVTVSAGSLVGAGPTGARLAVGWRTLAGGAAAAVSPPLPEEDPYAHLV
ncbi:hypothetical protein ACFY2T_40905 [Streptomyces sp. NPDC001260]|uniref:hypothetical protein n=1 Tax=Streptomyces sp. NPDC001260 TaxID=3364551 RepID=UPI0036A51BD9